MRHYLEKYLSLLETHIEKKHSIKDIYEGIYTVKDFESRKKDKGELGNLIQEFFNIKRNSASEPDFKELGLELKCTGLKATRNGLTAKERLILQMINYEELIHLSFEEAILNKCGKILIIFYKYEKNKPFYEWKLIGYGFLNFKEDLPSYYEQIKKDFEKIKQKVVDGLAHQISGKDTIFLEACPKGADSSVVRRQPNSSILAKQRAFSLKNKVLTQIYLLLSTKNNK